MKTIILTIAFLFSFQLTFGQENTAYEKAMLAKIDQLKQASNLEDHQSVANAFERIAQKEEKEWLPLYYAAYSYIKMGFMDKLTLTEKDNYFDKAQTILSNAETIEQQNSEITALKGYALMGKLTADAANRGQSLSPQVMQLFGKAIQQDPKNPRALYLMAQMEYGMAQFFGSGTEKACGMAKQSVALFEQTEEEGITPHWGENAAKEMMNRCQ